MNWRRLTPRRIWRLWFPQHFGLGLNPASFQPQPAISEMQDYIFWGLIDWHFRQQRPQHLANELVRLRRRVFYVSPNFVDNPKPGFRVESLDSNGLLFQIFFHRSGESSIYYQAPTTSDLEQLTAGIALMAEWAGLRRPISFVQHPFWTLLADSPHPTSIIYDRMDLHCGFHDHGESYSEGLADAERNLMHKADLTIASSDWLEQDSASYTDRRLLLRNGADYDHFAARPTRVFQDPKVRKVIGYFGAIAHWMDFDLVTAIAEEFPSCLLLLIGYDQCQAKRHFSGLDNIQLTGEIPYAQLPGYLHGFDVCILPFLRIPLTLATNPVKVYEYLSAGKSVVSVDLPETAAMSDLIRVAKDRTDFLRCIHQALAEDTDAVKIARRQAFASGQTWSHRVELLINAVERPVLPSPWAEEISPVVPNFRRKFVEGSERSGEDNCCRPQ